MPIKRFVVLASVVAVITSAAGAHAQIAVSANDNKVILVNGVVKPVPNAPPDTVTVIDLKASPPKTIAEVSGVPVSVVGPPLSVAITPDESLALVTASTKIDPSDPAKTVPDNRMSVIDLKATPPTVIATLETGRGPSGLSINRQGTLALVGNREDGTVSIFTIQGKTVTPAGNLALDAKSGTTHVAITPDGKTALVSRYLDNKISILSIDGSKVEYTKRDLSAGVRPGALEISPSGAWAVVGNLGGGQGDEETVSLIDLKAKPPRVVDTITVGQTPEGVKVSPDGMHVAVVVHNGSNKPKESPFFNDHGKLVFLRVDGGKLARVAELPIGHWAQGAAFSSDGKKILVGNMVEKDYQVFEWNGSTLRDTGVRLAVKGGAAAIRTAEK
jgi:DNA-binding beta-propeller fold protein YncE